MRNVPITLLLAMSALGMQAAIHKSDNLTKTAGVKPVVPLLARPLPLSAVRLTGGPLKHAQNLDAAYLLKLEPDRMMAYFRKRAGLEPKASPYGGWDGDGKNLTGHIAGHYLSAVSFMYAATGDKRFKERADYLVKEMNEVQDKHGNGYLGALANGEERFAQVALGNIRSASFDLNGLWSPWYVFHKVFAGLRDAHRHTGSHVALELETKYAAWAEGILSNLDDAQLQRMLNTEFGGMNEVLADLYADTGDKRWLAFADKFHHKAVVDPLSRHEDILAGKHGNTQVPKLLGSLARYIYTGDEADGRAAEFFWDAVVSHHSFATGGHGHDEYFGLPDRLSDMVDGRTAETCNVYNMLKMTRILFALHPDIKYADFEERALFNHILASMDPKDGRTCYMVPVGRGVRHEYQDMTWDFTCCVGSGMESHALHGDGIYYESPHKLWVNLYAPSTVDWRSEGTKLNMETDFPEGESAALKVSMSSPRSFTIALRRPFWAGQGFVVKVNGQLLGKLPSPGSYVEIRRKWKTGDTVSLTLRKALRLEPTPDNPNRVALMWGPLALAGDMGPEQGRRGRAKPEDAPVLVADNPVSMAWLRPETGKPGKFTANCVQKADGSGTAEDVGFIPFYRLHERSYAVYWDLYSTSQWHKRVAEVAAERERLRKLEAATVSYVQAGDLQSERGYNLQGDDAFIDRSTGRPGRRARRWFSFDVPIDAGAKLAMIITCRSSTRIGSGFDILIDGHRIATQSDSTAVPARYFDVEYALPADLTVGKKKVAVRFQSINNAEVGPIFGIRIIRSDQK